MSSLIPLNDRLVHEFILPYLSFTDQSKLRKLSPQTLHFTSAVFGRRCRISLLPSSPIRIKTLKLNDYKLTVDCEDVLRRMLDLETLDLTGKLDPRLVSFFTKTRFPRLKSITQHGFIQLPILA